MRGQANADVAGADRPPARGPLRARGAGRRGARPRAGPRVPLGERHRPPPGRGGLGGAPRARALARRRPRPPDAARPGAAGPRRRRSRRGSRRSSAPSSAGTRRARRPRSTGYLEIGPARVRPAVGDEPADPRPRPGHDVVAGDRVRPRRPAGRERPAAVRAAVPVAGPRDPRPGGDLVEPARGRARGRPRRSAAPSGSRRSGSRTSARRRSSGIARPASRSPTRSSGRAGSPRRPASACAPPATRPLFRERTGLPLDAYFSGPKIAHILDAVPGARSRAERGELAFGTVDSFLLWRLTGGRRARPRDRRLERQPDAPLRHPPARLGRRAARARRRAARRVLPEVAPDVRRLRRDRRRIFGRPIPIAALAGDQQAATFGQACFEPGQAKNTYGTGAFLLLNTGDGAARLGERPADDRRLAARAGRAARRTPSRARCSRPARPSSGCATASGSSSAPPTSRRSPRRVADSGGVYLVPAFTGLGAPYWDPERARHDRRHHPRAPASPRSPGRRSSRSPSRSPTSSRRWPRTPGSGLRALRVDGGAAANDLLLQLQADLLGVPVERPVVGRDDRARRGVPRRPRGRLLATASTTSRRTGRSTAGSSRRCRPIGARSLLARLAPGGRALARLGRAPIVRPVTEIRG